MQSVSADLDAAILARQRQPLCRLRVDWDDDGSFTTTGSGYQDDISADVVSVDLNRELSTDLPVQAKLFAGSAAAQATITLAHRDPAGDPTHHGGWFYSALNSASPLFAKQRKGRAATLEFGFVTAAGTSEYVTVLVGTVRSLTVSAGAREATMVIADGSETMRGQTLLPMVIADGGTATAVKHPGLDSTFLADWILRANGYYTSPPQRTGCLFLATMHGSGYPEVGTVRNFYGANGSQLAFVPTVTHPTTAKWVRASATDGTTSQATDYTLDTSGTISSNNTRTMLYEGWHKFTDASVDNPLFYLFRAGVSTPWVSAFFQGSTGQFKVTFNRGSTDTTDRVATGPTVSPSTGWHYWGVHVQFTSTGVNVTFRYDSATTGPVNVVTPSVTGAGAMDTIAIARARAGGYVDTRMDGFSEAVQLTTESSAGSWNDGFSPTAAVNVSAATDNKLVATPIAREEGWALLQELARADFSTVGFTETGTPTWWPRDRWTTAPYDTSQRTLTAAASLKELATTEAVDQVRNHIIIRSSVPAVGASRTVWKLATPSSISAGSTRTILARLQTPAGNIDTSVAFGTALGSSRYLAGTVPNGTGTSVSNLTFTVTQLDPETIRVVASNAANAFRVYLTGDANDSATYAGVPYLWLDGEPVDFSADTDGATGDTQVEASDSASIAAYGEYILELAGSDYRQDDDDLQTLADDLIADLADPGPAITDVPAVGDPRLQLGDRVTIVDPDGLVMSDDFHLSAVNFSYDSGGLGMVLSLRKA